MSKKDEEKAREIQANDVCCVWNGGCPNVRSGAMKMAQWKDEQLKQFLKDRYNKNLGSIISWEAESIYIELFNEPISEHPMNF